MDRIAKLQLMLKDAGDDSFLRHALALEYIKIGNDAEAELLFNAILFADPDYVGSYYHLARLLERNGDKAAAMTVYKKGIETAQRLSDHHAKNELQNALMDLEE